MQSDLNGCLAHHVLLNPDPWLGVSSPSALNRFLLGAQWRAIFAGLPIPAWRIWGPLDNHAFTEPILRAARFEGRPIGWANAFEFRHFSASAALEDIRGRIESFAADPGFSDELVETRTSVGSPQALLSAIAARPSMYLDDPTGLGLQQFLHGATRGGDWLGAPGVPRLQETTDLLEARSREIHGTPFAAYRIRLPAELLDWAGIKPLQPWG